MNFPKYTIFYTCKFFKFYNLLLENEDSPNIKSEEKDVIAELKEKIKENDDLTKGTNLKNVSLFRKFLGTKDSKKKLLEKSTLDILNKAICRITNSDHQQIEKFIYDNYEKEKGNTKEVNLVNSI